MGTTIARWMAKELKGVAPRLRTDTLTALCDATRAGLGVAALPCYLGDSHPDLRRVRAPIPEMSSELWVLTHADLRDTARVRAMTDWLVNALGAQRDLFEGRRPQR